MPNRDLKDQRRAEVPVEKPPPAPKPGGPDAKAPPPSLGSTIDTIKQRRKLLDEI